MITQPPHHERRSVTSRILWCLVGLVCGAFFGFAVGYQYGFPYSVIAALMLGVLLAADGARVGGGILGSIAQAFFYL